MPEKMSKATKYFLADAAMAADKFREKRPDKRKCSDEVLIRKVMLTP